MLVQLDTLYIDEVRRSASSAKVHGHMRRNVASVVGATSSDGGWQLLKSLNTSVCVCVDE